MPRVIGYTPPWLSKPSPGASIFSDPYAPSPPSPLKRQPPSSAEGGDYHGPKQLIAHRGTEIFTAVGNQLRWADLAKVKDHWEEQLQARTRRSEDEDSTKVQYRTLTTPVYYQIRELVISPSGHFLAICTEHTVHIAFLPDHARLADQPESPLKLSTRQLGPTTHVIPESPLASVVWHPLAASSPSTDCLVTVTAESAVRVWELDKSNKWSFERPALAIDLRKLADGVSCDQDFQPLGFGKRRGFSVDDFDMEAAASCFGGQGFDDEDAWASMTLWTAMKNGDIYALCPLLPSKWRPTSTTIPSLTTSAVSQMAIIDGEDPEADERRAAAQQYEWVQEIDNEEPLDEGQGTRLRPHNPGPIPRLQGPFSILPEDEEADPDVTDLIVFPARLDESIMYSGEDDYGYEGEDEDSPRVPFTTLIIACSDGAIDVALDLEGVTGQWLPRLGRSTFSLATPETRRLDLVTTLTLDVNTSNATFLSFTADPIDRYGTFITAGTQIFSLSLYDWIVRTAAELSADQEVDPGLRTRLEAISTQIGDLHDVLTTDSSDALSSPIAVSDLDLGYFLLSLNTSRALAVSFDQYAGQTRQVATSDLATSQLGLLEAAEIDESKALPLPSRQIYSPAQIFYSNAEAPLLQLKSSLAPQQRRILSDQPMRLSPAMLDVMTATHRTVSRQTSELESAAAELFRRCERLQEELADQVKQMAELADRLNTLRSPDLAEGEGRPGEQVQKTADERLDAAKAKQVELTKRFEALRRKVGRIGTARKELSAKELAWKEEIEALSRIAGVSGGDEEEEKQEDEEKDESLAGRLTTVEQLSKSLLSASQKVASAPPGGSKEEFSRSTNSAYGSPQRADPTGSGLLVSSRYQREKVAEAMAMVEREGAVIEATMGRLEGLQLAVTTI
ncbi:hypothetical protein DV735_g3919, partial [Chaetothyriales sp. CBS 134920]